MRIIPIPSSNSTSSNFLSFKIDEFAVVLKRDLQPHHEVLAELLGKQDKEKMDADKRQRWDRQIFMSFAL